jgi:integrase
MHGGRFIVGRVAMKRNRHALRGERGRFAARPGVELKRGRGEHVGGRPQIRAKHKRALTDEEIDHFLSIVAETCNVSLAARETGRSARVFYALKRRDADFRAAWIEALREGYDQLEMELVRRARFGTARAVFHQGRRTGTTRVFNDAAALRLLHFHRRTVEPLRAADEQRPRDAAAIFDELAARVAEIRAERAAKDGEADGGRA